MGETWTQGTPGLAEELAALEELLRAEFGGEGLVRTDAAALLLGGGKRLRPALVIGSAMLGRYDRGQALPVAAAAEALHAATLAHDDVIDEADSRRGRPALHRQRGNHIAIYTGDYLLGRALLLLSRSGLAGQDIGRFATAIDMMCTGEVAQYLGRDRVPGYREYLRRIIGKTGVLFAACCVAGGRLGGLSDREVNRLWRFGLHLGAAFQIRDDLIDVAGDGAAAGKPVGHDLIEGVVTLPVLLAAANADYRRLLGQYLGGAHTAEGARELMALARSAGAVEDAARRLSEQVERSLTILAGLPAGPGRDALTAIARRMTPVTPLSLAVGEKIVNDLVASC